MRTDTAATSSPVIWYLHLVQAKGTVQSLLENLPDDCSINDVLYHLHVIQLVERGRADAEPGRLISHEVVAEEMRQKWQVGR